MAVQPQAGILKQAPLDSAAKSPLLGDREANYPDGHDEATRRPAPPGWWPVSWLTILGFAFLTFNSVMAVIRSHGDTSAILFVAFSYGDLVLLFVCLRLYEGAPANSPARWRLKVAVWILTTLLTVAFSYKVAALMPPPVAVLVWLMAFATVAGGFVAFFLYREKN